MYAIKVELKLNNSEKTLMNRHLGFSRFCYNYALSIYNQLDNKKYKGGSSKKIDLIKKIFTNVTKKKSGFAWTNEMSSRVYQNAFRALKTAFSRYWKGLGGLPKFKKKKHPGSFTVDSSNGVILQEGGHRIKLPTLGFFRITEAIPKCVSQTYTVSKRGERYYVSFSINAELIPPIQHEIFDPVGIDVNLSQGKYCVISDGTMIAFPKPLKAAITKLEKLQYHNRNKQLGNRKQKISPSNNSRKYYKKLAELHKKVADARNDFLQKLTTKLAIKYRHIKLETLNIKGMMANGKLAMHIADASFYKFKTLLINKANTYGGFVESVNQWYPSSKLCSNCGNKKLDLKLSERVYHCEQCNLNLDRDLNSAINLKLAKQEHITNRVGSTRIEACGHDTADGHEKSCNARKQEANIKVDNFG